MSEGTPKAIEMKGITRNATKIGVQDGQAEDLINLRFMDGSWRASGNGRQIVNMPTGTIYEQLYVHTNIYHHLLGVDNGTLYWFAEIDNDGVTFYPLDGTSDRSLWPEDKQDLPTERVALTTVTGDMWITQNGHLLTIIDESDDFEFFVFKTGDDKYIEVNVDTNGKATSRSLYPFGQVHFNLYSPSDDNDHKHIKINDATWNVATIGIAHADMLEMYKKATEKNQFTRPFLAVVACVLYDGSYAFASQPTFLFPRELAGLRKHYYREVGTLNVKGEYTVTGRSDISLESIDRNRVGFAYQCNSFPYLTDETAVVTLENVDALDKANTMKSALVRIDTNDTDYRNSVIPIPTKSLPVYSNGMIYGQTKLVTCVMGSDLVLSLSNYDFIDSDVIKGIGVFITPQIDIFNMSAEGYKDSVQYKNTADILLKDTSRTRTSYFHRNDDDVPDADTRETTIATYIPGLLKQDKILYDLLHSQFHLLKFYDKNTIAKLKDNPIINLSEVEDEYVLNKIIDQNTLPTETVSRITYLPKVSYMYNNRLHIANYYAYPFFGYPIDLFHLHNHSVKVQDGAWFPADADGQRVLPNLADNNDAYLQYTKDTIDIEERVDAAMQQQMISINAPYFLIKVIINTEQGKQEVCRWIPAYDTSTAPEHTANFIEDLNPLLTYPDARAEQMEIYYFYFKTYDISQREIWVYHTGTLKLKPHPYLNIAYYIEPNLKPISMWQVISQTKSFTEPTAADMMEFVKMQNAEEYFPNGLKVSKTDNPMFFPVEKTYQVGSSEILALMSSTIPLGTGQTGAAPLVVFCKDGVYALLMGNIVPDTEKVTDNILYASAVPIARDVCNNPRSVTPVDGGVVFSTDRGLMKATYDGKNFQVQEIGAPAEGDVVQFWNAGSVDYSKIATASMQQIAGLPSSLCSTTDFLTYLQDKGTSGKAAIINYNHNMRELMVSNPNYPYSYVLDREGNWSRRDYTAAQYVNNYPTSYRVDANGHFYKVDDEGEATTSLEHRKEADNKIFYLSNVIKLDSIGFKQAYRFVVRGYFETMVGANIACVVEGSYDGRKFKPLGYNRKSGKFRDIGCLVSHTDMRFYRVCLAGQVTGKTRIDYMEMSAGASMLNTKIR